MTRAEAQSLLRNLGCPSTCKKAEEALKYVCRRRKISIAGLLSQVVTDQLSAEKPVHTAPIS